MKTTKHILLIAVALTAALVTVARAAAKVGAAAPDFTVTDVDGQTHRLADYKGRVVVLEWINPECPFVQKHYGSGNIPRLQKSATNDGVVWLTINSAHDGGQGDYETEAMRAWFGKQDAAPTAYVRDQDGKLGRLYGAKTTPHLFVIDESGTLVYAGAIDSIRSADVEDLARATNYVSAALAAVREGRPVETATSQPYGCSVKY